MSISEAKWFFLPFVLASSITSDFSDFCHVPRSNLFKFLSFFIHCCFCCGYLHCLRHRNKFVYQIVMLQWIVTFSCNMVLMIFWWRCFHTHSCGFAGFQDTRKFRFEITSLATGLTILAFLACLAKHSGSHWCFHFSSIPNGFLWTPCPLGQWNRFLVIFQHYRGSVFH